MTLFFKAMSHVMIHHPVQMRPHAVRRQREAGLVVLFQRYELFWHFVNSPNFDVIDVANAFMISFCHSQAVCCEDLIHYCPHGKKCNLAAMTCDDETCSVPLVKKIPTIPRQGAQAGNVPCDTTSSCPDETTCCKNKTGGWACCPLPEVNKHVHLKNSF